MLIHIFFKRLIFVICNLLIAAALSGQIQNTMAQADSSAYMSMKQLLNKLEQKHAIQFYYNPQWFTSKKFPVALANLSLDEALLRVKRLTGYTCLTIGNKAYVFVPEELAVVKHSEKDHSVTIVVGNMSEFGKFSRVSLTGKIVDGKSGEPLVGAILIIDKQKVALTTDKNGAFSLMLPVGDYDLKLRYMGYEDDIQNIKLVSNGSVNLELFEKSVHIDEIIISAEKAEVNVSRTQMSMVKLNSKAIKELPVSLGEKDIIKSFTLMPGIQTVGEFGTGFNVRGGSADQNLILVEDVPLFNSSHIFGLTSAVNSDNILDATLLKAGIPSQYGERASSVMDIHLGSTDPNVLKVKGGIGLLNSRLSVETPLNNNKMFIQIGSRTSYSDWLLKQMPDIDLMNSSASFYDVNGLLTYNLNSANKLTLFGYYSDDKFSFGRVTHYIYNNTLASLKWNHVFNSELSGSLMAGMSQYAYQKNDHDNLQLGLANTVTSLTSYYKVKWNMNWLPVENHSVNIGADGIQYVLNPGTQTPDGVNSIVKPLQLNHEKALELSLYISDNYTVTSKLTVELGMRFTEYLVLGPSVVNSYDPAFARDLPPIGVRNYGNNAIVQKVPRLEPRISVRYTLTDESSVKFSYNRINQFINLISNTTVESPTDVWQLSNPNIKPLQSDQYALGYFRNFHKNTYESSLEFYYKGLNHLIDYKEGASILMNPNLEQSLIDGKGYNYGSEIYLKKNTGALTGWISYTYSVSKRKTTSNFTEEQVLQNRYYSSTYDRPHNLVLNANYHASRRWRFAGSFTYSTGRPQTFPEYISEQKGFNVVLWSDRNKYRLPDYHRLDISVSLDETLRIKKKWKGSWTFSIVNVYGRKNVYSTFYKHEARDASNNFRSYSYYKMYIIGKPLPTLTYNFTF